jgi:hypothetical protein
MDEEKDNSHNWSTIQISLRHYCNKVIALTEDENVKKGNDIIKNDILEHLAKAQNIILQFSSLGNMSVEEGLTKEYKIFETSKNIILASLFLYREELNHSKQNVAEKLNEGLSDKLNERDLPFSNFKGEIDKIEKALQYVNYRSQYA